MNRIGGTNGKAKHEAPVKALPDFVLLTSDESFAELGHGVKPPKVPVHLFGPPKFTKEQQDANPDKPMTRVVKDALRVGWWRTGWDKERRTPTFNDFTADELKNIERWFREGQKLGEAANLGKTHGIERALKEIEEMIKDLPPAEKKQRRRELRDQLVRDDALVHPDDIIQPISNTVFDGKTLWIESYVTPDQAKYLTTSNGRKVSVGLKRNYQAGNGAVLPVWMKHVAITDRPVVTGQGPWTALANEFVGSDPEEEDEVDDEEEGTTFEENDGNVPFDVVVDRFNRALDLLGMPYMPNTVTAKTFPDVSDALLKTKEPDETEEEEAVDQSTTLPGYDVTNRIPDPTLMSNTEPPNMPPENKNDAGDAAKALGELIIDLRASVTALNARLDKIEAGEFTAMSNFRTELDGIKGDMASARNGTSKAAYLAKLTGAAETRVGVNANTVEKYTKRGEETDWNLSNLDFIDDLPAKNKTPISRRELGVGSEKPGEMSNEDIQKAADMLVAR